jgi:hypothetical protein
MFIADQPVLGKKKSILSISHAIALWTDKGHYIVNSSFQYDFFVDTGCSIHRRLELTNKTSLKKFEKTNQINVADVVIENECYLGIDNKKKLLKEKNNDKIYVSKYSESA